jgi:hypothetical protein
MEIYDEQEWEFDEKMKTLNLKDVIKLIINGYKEKYPQHKFFAGCFYDTKTGIGNVTYPDHLGQYDYYQPSSKMGRKDIKHLIMHIDKGIKGVGNARYMKELELEFFEPQNFDAIVKNTLKGKDFSISHTSNSTIYKVKDSAISEVEISSLQFKLRTNPQKWIAYYG